MNFSEAQQCAQSELQSGESLYWSGTADPRRVAITALPASLFGIPFAGFALFWIYTAFSATNAMSRSNHNSFTKGFALFPLFGLPFLLVGLGVILTPLWAYRKGLSTVYAVTNKRIMVIAGSGNRTVKSILPADIVGVDHRERPDGSGDIVIQTSTLLRSNNNSISQAKVALCGIPDVKQVVQQVMALHTQRSTT